MTTTISKFGLKGALKPSFYMEKQISLLNKNSVVFFNHSKQLIELTFFLNRLGAVVEISFLDTMQLFLECKD